MSAPPGAATGLDLRCPACGEAVRSDPDACACAGCGRTFPVLLGIPDLRVPVRAFVDFEEDRALARDLATGYAQETSGSLVGRVWARRVGVPGSLVQRRLGEIARAEAKYAAHLATAGWLGPPVRREPPEAALEIGCGPGSFLVPASRCFRRVVGVDISLAWLVIARKRLEEQGLGASLVCACAERLPLADGQFDLVAAFDTLEHVADPVALVREAVRVARLGGRIAATTPNRFSLSAEPHVGVWGVGFLPRAWMAPYVRWRNGMAYRHTYPLSLADVGRLLGGAPECAWSVTAPAVWEGDRQAFPPARRALAGLYNALIEGRLARRLVLPVAPFFEILGRKR